MQQGTLQILFALLISFSPHKSQTGIWDFLPIHLFYKFQYCYTLLLPQLSDLPSAKSAHIFPSFYSLNTSFYQSTSRLNPNCKQSAALIFFITSESAAICPTFTIIFLLSIVTICSVRQSDSFSQYPFTSSGLMRTCTGFPLVLQFIFFVLLFVYYKNMFFLYFTYFILNLKACL